MLKANAVPPLAFFLAVALLPASVARAAPKGVTFTASASQVEAYDFIEITLAVDVADAANPFTDATVRGHFEAVSGAARFDVDGFADSPDGSRFRIRFMPGTPGRYTYNVEYRQGPFTARSEGTFLAAEGNRRGVLRVDPEHPWHFIWEGSKEHYFLNGTTAFLLLGWDDEAVIRRCLDRFREGKVNRVRVLLYGRTDHFWTEPVRAASGWRAWLNPWVARKPDDVLDPGFDYTRFNLPYWEKFERMLRYAREKDISISVVFHWNDTPVHPAPLSDDEKRYFQYAAARLSAFSNVTWDLGDDLDSFRTDAWTHAMGVLLKGWDPYRHLATSHPVDNVHQDRASEWFDMTSFQEWHRPLHGWMLNQRKEQVRAGRIIPQINEEYGYEDHYPDWNPVKSPGCSAEGNRLTAWEIAMAGTYQTTGETAKRGTGFPPDTGGGWINGRGDDSMKLLAVQAPMVDYFTSFEWWKTEPHDELVDHGAFCLADPGRLYAVYLPQGGAVSVKIEPGAYQASRFNPRTGEGLALPAVEGPAWTSPAAPDGGDWAYLLKRK